MSMSHRCTGFLKKTVKFVRGKSQKEPKKTLLPWHIEYIFLFLGCKKMKYVTLSAKSTFFIVRSHNRTRSVHCFPMWDTLGHADTRVSVTDDKRHASTCRGNMQSTVRLKGSRHKFIRLAQTWYLSTLLISSNNTVMRRARPSYDL